MRKSNVLLALTVAGVLVLPIAHAQAGNVSRLPGQTQHAPPPTPEERVGKLDTAGRARLLLEADQATREAFADYQRAVAKAKEKGKAPATAADAVLALDPMRAPRAALRALGDDMSNEALAVQDADRGTRNTYDKFTKLLDEEDALVAAAGEQAKVSAFGVEATAQQ